jgi:orotidine-5'-phosphate decarboxylase
MEAAGPACVAVKPQMACFERFGSSGWEALEQVVARAAETGLLVVADGKRGDIDVSAAAYGEAFFETLGADALTASPLLGADSLQPMLDAARARGGGLFVLVRTSNAGAADLQDLELAAGGTLSERLAELVAGLGRSGEHGLADVGAVVGATAPGRLERLRELMPRTPFLLPGVGAQGGRVEDLGAAWAPGPAGGIVTASRSIARAHEAAGDDPPTAARAEAERLRELAWQLA